jgi:hypothetical protein
VEYQQENANAVTYQKTNTIKLNELNEMSQLTSDQDGNLFFDTSVDREADIVDNFTIVSNNSTRIKVTYFIGKNEYPHYKVDEFVLVSALYEDFKIRITFLQTPGENEEIKIISRQYILNLQDRRLLRNSIVVTRNFFYGNGMCCENNQIDKTQSF